MFSAHKFFLLVILALSINAVNCMPKRKEKTTVTVNEGESAKRHVARKKKSSIWEIGLFKTLGEEVAECQECKQKLSRKWSTSTLKDHLFSAKHANSKYAEHFIKLDEERKARIVTKKKPTIESYHSQPFHNDQQFQFDHSMPAAGKTLALSSNFEDGFSSSRINEPSAQKFPLSPEKINDFETAFGSYYDNNSENSND